MTLFEIAKNNIEKEGRNAGKSTGLCYRYVKKALNDRYTIKLSGGSAIDSFNQLQNFGFENKIDVYKTPRKAPKDSLLVYSGGTHGHIEIASGDGWYASDYISKNPRTCSPLNDVSCGRGRSLIGIFIKTK